MPKKTAQTTNVATFVDNLVLVTRDESAVKAFLDTYQGKLRGSPCGLHIKVLPPTPLSPVITEAQELGYLEMLLRSLAAADSPASLAEALDDIDLLQSHTEFPPVYDRCGAALAERHFGYSPSEPAKEGL